MSKLSVTNFSKRTGSPFQNKSKETQEEQQGVTHDEVLQKTNMEKQKEKQSELLHKVNKKTAEYQANKPSSGVFTEVVTHGAFTSKTAYKNISKVENVASQSKSTNGSNGSKLLGFPSSANDLALDAKSDLESDPNISKEVKEKVIEKLFTLVSMVQHTYESKVRIMTEYEKFKDTHLKNELRREKEHSEQLYKINMNFQNEVIQSIQQLKSELDIARNITKNLEESNTNIIDLNNSSVDFNTSEDVSDSRLTNDTDILIENKSEPNNNINDTKTDEVL
ncbi:uncharacterized protein LOC113514536 [Galleria mellonella]|uniref:Uncharacterized protein LOC113514536 n=1 Tax=Galleria mellonella TaxID=7137 RepID=A0A6J3BW12_GALME|nr:uncharacterized protein LOC113514536 [Galleria mellonella]